MLQTLKLLPLGLLLCAIAAAVAAEETVGGPAVVNVGPRTATVVWLVSDAQSTLGETIGDQKLIAKTIQVRKTVYTGLKPGTTYYYTAPAGTGHFKTAPARSPVNLPAAVTGTVYLRRLR